MDDVPVNFLSGLIDVCERIKGGAQTVSALPMSPGEVAAQYYLPLSGHRGAPHMVPETPLKLFWPVFWPLVWSVLKRTSVKLIQCKGINFTLQDKMYHHLYKQ